MSTTFNLFSGRNKQQSEVVSNFLERPTFAEENETTTGRRTFYQKGIVEAGHTGGSLAALRAGLARVWTHAVNRATKDEASREQYREGLLKEIQAKQEQINSLEQKIATKTKAIETIEEVQVPRFKQEIERLETQKDNLTTRISAMRDAVQKNPVSRVLYWTLMILGTLYLYMFYVTASYSALFRSPGESVEEATKEESNLNAVFSAIFDPDAYTTFNFHWIIPVAFLMLGILLHLALDTKGWKMWVWVPLSILVVLAADGILAFFMESRAHEMKFMTGADDQATYTLFGDAITDPNFYFILILGTASVVSWTIIVHLLKNLYGNEPALREIQTQTEILNRKIAKEEANKDKAETQQKVLEAEQQVHELEIEGLRDSIAAISQKMQHVTYSPSKVADYVLEWFKGWMGYVSMLDQDGLEEESLAVFREAIAGMNVSIPGFDQPIRVQETVRVA